MVTVMGWSGGVMGFGGWLTMGGLWLAVLALVLFLIVRLLPAGRRVADGDSAESAADILDRRFARGEIDEATYTARRTALARHHGERLL